MSYIIEIPKVGGSSYVGFAEGKYELNSLKEVALVFASKDRAERTRREMVRENEIPNNAILVKVKNELKPKPVKR